MGFGSLWHWIIVLLIVIILFGRGRVAEIMGDFGKGIKSFKQGLNDEEKVPAKPAGALEAKPAEDSVVPKPEEAGDRAN